MRCPNISGRVQSGLTSTSSCTAAFEAKFSLIVTLGTINPEKPHIINMLQNLPYLAIDDYRFNYNINCNMNDESGA